MDIINAVLESTKSFEAPRRFYYWSTLAAISAVLKDRVWFDMIHYNLYPNIYVLLYGPSGIRKGPAIALAEDLVSRVDNTRVIDGRSSIEAVIKELGTAETRPGKEMIKDACGFMVASELSSSIISNTAAMDIMTNLYDRIYNEKEWRYRLKVGESARLLKPTITWLAGTNEALFREFIPEKNLNGGLIGRMFVIIEDKIANINSLMFKTVAPDKIQLGMRLKEISRLTGEYKMTDEVRHAVDTWYTHFKKEKSPYIMDDTGFVSRVEDFVLKLAMIISAGRRLDREIRMDDFIEAAEQVMPLINPTQGVVHSVKKEDYSKSKKRMLVLKYLANRPECKDTRIKILQNLGLHIGHVDLDEIAENLIQMNVLTIDTHGATMTYRLRLDRPDVAELITKYRYK